MRELVLKVRAELGTGVILASHLLEDVERCADQLVILDKGHLKASGSMAGLRKMLAKRFELRFMDPLSEEQRAKLDELLVAGTAAINELFVLQRTALE